MRYEQLCELADSAHDSQAAADRRSQFAEGPCIHVHALADFKRQVPHVGCMLRQPGQQRLRPRQRPVASNVHDQLPQQLRAAAQGVEPLADEGHRAKTAKGCRRQASATVGRQGRHQRRRRSQWACRSAAAVSRIFTSTPSGRPSFTG